MPRCSDLWANDPTMAPNKPRSLWILDYILSKITCICLLQILQEKIMYISGALQVQEDGVCLCARVYLYI